MTGPRQHRSLGADYACVFATLALSATYVVLDVSLCLGASDASVIAPLLGIIFMSAAMLAGVTGGVIVGAIALAPSVPRVWMRALGAIAVTLYPARWLATTITAGSGVTRSGWAVPLRWFIAIGLLIAATSAVTVLPALHRRTTRQTRWVLGAAIGLLGVTAVAITSQYGTTYIRAYRGVLIIASLLIEIGVVFALAHPGGHRSSRRSRVAAASVLAALFFGGLALSKFGGSARFSAVHIVFTRTLVSQKMQAVVLRVSPVHMGDRRVSLAETRLSHDNNSSIPPRPRGEYARANVLFVTFDALRSDIVDEVIDGQPVAPNIQKLKQGAFSFVAAYASYSHTSRSILSILAGTSNVPMPSETTVSNDPVEVRARTRLPRLLRKAGYETVADVMAGRWGEVFFDKDRFAEFDRHIAAGTECTAQVRAFKEYLAQRDVARPFWAWVHMFDTHTPLISTRTDALFGPSRKGVYAAAVHHADSCLGGLLSALQEADRWTDTIVVVTADHGEALGEHDRFFEHSTCYLHDLHIPLLVRLPGQRTPHEIEYPIQPPDLLPTIANLLGVDVDERDVDGDDLSGLLAANGSTVDRNSRATMAFSRGHEDQYPCASVIAGNWHLIFTDAAGSYELYDIAADPHEQNNLVSERPDILEELMPIVDSYRSIGTDSAAHELAPTGR